MEEIHPFDTLQESLVNKGLSFLLLADKLNWTNKETLRCLESLSWYHSLRNTQRHHTQASSPPDLMLSDMTFTSRPAQWKAPQVISPCLSLSLPFPSPPPQYHVACLVLSQLWSGTNCHLYSPATHRHNHQHADAAKHDWRHRQNHIHTLEGAHKWQTQTTHTQVWGELPPRTEGSEEEDGDKCVIRLLVLWVHKRVLKFF